MKDTNFNQKTKERKIDYINKVKNELFRGLIETVDEKLRYYRFNLTLL